MLVAPGFVSNLPTPPYVLHCPEVAASRIRAFAFVSLTFLVEVDISLHGDDANSSFDYGYRNAVHEMILAGIRTCRKFDDGNLLDLRRVAHDEARS